MIFFLDLKDLKFFKRFQSLSLHFQSSDFEIWIFMNFEYEITYAILEGHMLELIMYLHSKYVNNIPTHIVVTYYGASVVCCLQVYNIRNFGDMKGSTPRGLNLTVSNVTP